MRVKLEENAFLNDFNSHKIIELLLWPLALAKLINLKINLKDFQTWLSPDKTSGIKIYVYIIGFSIKLHCALCWFKLAQVVVCYYDIFFIWPSACHLSITASIRDLGAISPELVPETHRLKIYLCNCNVFSCLLTSFCFLKVKCQVSVNIAHTRAGHPSFSKSPPLQ